MIIMQSLSPSRGWGPNLDINIGLLGPQRLNIGPHRVLMEFPSLQCGTALVGGSDLFLVHSEPIVNTAN
jgi:hypothetical protein